MESESDILRALNPERTLPPPTESDFATAIETLGYELPPPLKEIYGFCGGIVGPTDTWYLLPLIDGPDEETSLVSENLFWRPDGDAIPEWIDDFVCFGFGTDQCNLAVGRKSPYTVIRYYLPDSGEYEKTDGGIFDAIQTDKGEFDEMVRHEQPKP
ncbi:SMI1/KNR4 family protein [Haloferula chungangensis]|uniref:SMI1/KNR4 family protein n=1 Tax=Haloferula chungangensis TaxID=1048331 RepID=A0ABW2LDL2_9BACT